MRFMYADKEELEKVDGWVCVALNDLLKYQNTPKDEYKKSDGDFFKSHMKYLNKIILWNSLANRVFKYSFRALLAVESLLKHRDQREIDNIQSNLEEISKQLKLSKSMEFIKSCPI